MRVRIQNIVLSAVLLLSAASCSTTRVLQDGQYRLESNRVEVLNDPKFNTRELQPYIKQKAKGWDPFLVVYNWGGSGNGLISRMFRKIGVAPVVYRSEQVEPSAESIKRHLEYIGWYDSTVEPEVFVKRKKVRVKYLVTLGKRYPIDSISFSLPQGGDFEQDFLRDTSNMTIRRGQFLSEAALEKESARSSAYFRNQGYYGFNKNYYFFEADTLADPSKVALEMRINGYTRNEQASAARVLQRATFGEVRINYPKSLKIREVVLKDMNLIKPGGSYSEDIVNATYNRFSALRMFNNVNIELNQRSGSPVVDCDINLSPSKMQGFKMNLEASSNSSGLLGISPELSFYHKNFFRGGEWLNLGFMGNFQFKPNSNVRSTEFGVSMGISLPRFLFLPRGHMPYIVPRTEINASYNYQDRPEYRRNIISTSFGYNGSSGNLYYQIYPVQLNIVRLFNLNDKFYASMKDNPFMRNAYQDHFDFGFGTTLNYSTDVSANPQGTYHYAKLSFNSAGNLLSALRPVLKKDDNGSAMIWDTPFSQYVRAEVTLGKTWRFGKNDGMGIATRFIAGAGLPYGNSTVLPFEQHFYSGGANSLRGWQARSVGPGLSKKDNTFVIPNQTGDMKLEANVEYRFNMFWKIAGAVFIDAGNVWTIKENDKRDSSPLFTMKNFSESIAADFGFGIRLDLSFILLRLDTGFKVHDPSQDPGQRWIVPKQWLTSDGYAVHFGVGYPF